MQESEEGAETAIDPGGGDSEQAPPTVVGDGSDPTGEPPPASEPIRTPAPPAAAAVAPPPPEPTANEPQEEEEEEEPEEPDTVSRRWSLEATAGVSQGEEEEEDLMPSVEGGSVDSETFVTDTETEGCKSQLACLAMASNKFGFKEKQKTMRCMFISLQHIYLL